MREATRVARRKPARRAASLTRGRSATARRSDARRQGDALAQAGASAFWVADCYSRGARALRDAGEAEAAEAGTPEACRDSEARNGRDAAPYLDGGDLTEAASWLPSQRSEESLSLNS